MGKLFVVGTGPGDLKHMTFEAQAAIRASEVVVGYKVYLDLIRPLLFGKELVSSGMMREKERCCAALEIAASGRTVSIVSSGDAGIYGMAGLVLELANGGGGANHELPLQDVEIVVVPGISALQAAASVLGAPLMHDFAAISLSDLLTPWQTIRKRLQAASQADFVVALYNPRSKGRVKQLEEAREIFLKSRSRETPVGIVRNACREGEERIVTTLGAMLEHPVDMFSMVIIGNGATLVDRAGRMITPRGYGSSSTFDVQRSMLTEKDLEPRTSNIEPHHGKAVMVCGTASDVGKSVLAAGLCRLLRRRGLRVAPFKSQNMALNAAVTPEGGEIGRAQAVQAAACRIAPHTDMNPVLLKPTTDLGSQVIVQGEVVATMSVKEYNAFKPQVFERVRESFDRLRNGYDFVVIEGAGSIAEINLKAHDIANLRVAAMADCPVLLVADIDRGGVFAQIVGTLELLEPEERARISGVIINKFRGDASLLTPGIEFVEKRTGVPVLGVVPCFTGFRIPEEDSVALEKRGPWGEAQSSGNDRIRVGVVRLPRISNYTDFDALEAEEDLELSYLDEPRLLNGLDLLVLPGSKATIADLAFLQESGLAAAIKAFAGPVVGVCGGYQMLGMRVSDPHGVESGDQREAEGLGLLDVVTVMLPHKETHQVKAELLPAGCQVASRCSRELTGYEIHMGETILGPKAGSFSRITSRSGEETEIMDGAVSRDGRVFGTYLHGVFDNDRFRTAFLNRLRSAKGLAERQVPTAAADPLDLLADHLERHLDMGRISAICGLTSA